MEARRAGDDLDVTLRRAVLERQVVLRQGPHDVEEEAAGEDNGALALDRGLGAYADAELHVGGLQLDAACAGLKADAGERLDRAAGRHAARGHTEAAYELFS